MALSFDKVFGVHQHTISVRAKRAEVLASNIANADTPGYQHWQYCLQAPQHAWRER